MRVCTVVAFPLGASDPVIKGDEAGKAIAAGAHEIDAVIAIGGLRQALPAEGEPDVGALARVLDDSAGRGLRRARGRGPRAGVRAPREADLETNLLDERQKIVGALLAVAAGADFVKTSTGFAGGATVADVALLRADGRAAAGVKASGGIRDRDTALALLRAGADRLGCSASLAILGA